MNQQCSKREVVSLSPVEDYGADLEVKHCTCICLLKENKINFKVLLYHIAQ